MDRFLYFEKFFEEDILEEKLMEEEKLENLVSDYFIKLRKKRDLIKNSNIIKKFWIGDILEFVYFFKSIALVFQGICISVRRKNFLVPFVTFLLRNIIMRIGIELIILYFFRRGFNLLFLDYKRKFFTFNRNKLYFIRSGLNRESRVK